VFCVIHLPSSLKKSILMVPIVSAAIGTENTIIIIIISSSIIITITITNIIIIKLLGKSVTRHLC